MENDSLIIRPFTKEHAIKAMAFVIEFSNEFQQEAYNELQGIEKSLLEELPRKLSHRALIINVGLDEAGASNLHAGESAGGFTLDKVMADGTPEWALTVQNNFVRVLCNKYERWDSTWSKARTYFAGVLPILLGHSTVKAVTLQYVDEFFIEGNIQEFTPDKLFRPESRYLTPIIFESKDLWHSHSGKLEKISETEKVLNVVNVSLVTENDSLKSQIVMTHKIDSINGTSLSDNNNTSDFLKETDAYMNQMHDFDKNILAELINEKHTQMIGLVI